MAPRRVRGDVATDVRVSASHKLAPSDFAFLWDECRRCFWLKTARGIDRVKTPMPSIFTAIDGRMKTFYEGRRTEQISALLPPGRVAHSGRWVESEPLALPGRATKVHVRGPFDTVLAFDDGSYAVVDFKTSHQKPDNVAKYARQLHAYAYALEHPAEGALGLSPVRRLGLLVFEPAGYDALPDSEATLAGRVQWVEIEKDEAAFLAFLAEVAAVLESPEPPEAAEDCKWCAFRAATRAHPY